MARFVELTMFMKGTPNSRLNPDQHTPTLINVDCIRWVRAAQDGEHAVLAIGSESGSSASYITVAEPYTEVARLLSGEPVHP